MALYRIEIDRSLCSGYGLCVDLAPDVLAAAAQCPMGAISVFYADSEEQAA